MSSLVAWRTIETFVCDSSGESNEGTQRWRLVGVNESFTE